MSTAVMPASDALGMRAARQPRARWLQVISHTDPRYGGLSAAVPALALSIAAQSRHDALLAAFCNVGEQYCPAEVRGEQITFWPASRRTWWLERSLKEDFASAVRGADALHIHGLWEASTAVSCATARRHSKPYVLSAHGMLAPWALAAKRWKKQIYAALIERENVAEATCLHALTAAEAEQYRKFGATAPIAIVPNAVDVPRSIEPEFFFERFP